MLGMNGRNIARTVFTPPAKLLVRLGVSQNVVTVVGTVLVVGAALSLLPTGHLFAGSLVIGALVCTDALDGTMARLTNTASKWGAFLDSTLDRVADAAVFAGLALFFVFRGQPWGAVAGVAALSLGQVVPYARARAEGLGFHAAIGLAERSDRLIVGLVAAAVVGLGADPLVLVIALAVLALASAITVGQRAAIVHRQWKAEQTGEKDVEPREGLA